MNNRIEQEKSAEDIALDWIIRMDGENPLTESEKIDLSNWLKIDPSHQKLLKANAQFWADTSLTDLYDLASHQAASTTKTKGDSAGGLFASNAFWGRKTIFTSFAVMSVFMVALLTSKILPDTVDPTNGLYATVVGEQKIHHLSDGSVVHLNTNSQLVVEYNDEQRNVWLKQGEAHFEVAKNKDRPFRVYTNGGRVEAIGTAFNVRVAENDIAVLVTEGRVSVAALGQENWQPKLTEIGKIDKLIQETHQLTELAQLDAGQGVKFNSRMPLNALANMVTNSTETVSEKELQMRQAWQTGVLVFNGQPLSEFISEITRFTHAKFEIEDVELNHIQVGGRYKIDSIDNVIVALEEQFGLKVTRTDYNTYKLSKGDCVESASACL